MTYPLTLTALFQSIGLSFGPMLPVVVLLLFAFLILPALMRPGAKAESLAYATYCCLAQMLAVILMSSSALPALYAVFAQQPLSEVTYLGLLITFAIGGLMFLLHDSRLRAIDPLSRMVPSTIFFVTWKFIGLLTVTFGGISFVLQLISAAERSEGWWVKDLVMILYGCILCWFTLVRSDLPAVTPVRPVIVPRPASKQAPIVKPAPVIIAKKPQMAKPKPKNKR